ncbi:MAG: hypothetical protein ACNA7G_10855 [Methylobacter sp.]
MNDPDLSLRESRLLGVGHEPELEAVMRLLEAIDDDPLHPANDARHPLHQSCLVGYGEMQDWVLEQLDRKKLQRLDY